MVDDLSEKITYALAIILTTEMEMFTQHLSCETKQETYKNALIGIHFLNVFLYMKYSIAHVSAKECGNRCLRTAVSFSAIFAPRMSFIQSEICS